MDHQGVVMIFGYLIITFVLGLTSARADLAREVFERAQQDGTLAALCQRLSATTDSELAIYDEEIDECKMPWLRARLETYWEQKAREVQEFRSEHQESPKFESFEGHSKAKDLLKPPKRSLDVPIPVVPNVEVEIDPTEAPTYFTAGLPLGYVALTFDDGPGATTTPGILRTLKAARVHATFFSVGRMAAQHPEHIRAEFEQGHTVGTHTWDHPHLPQLRIWKGKKSYLDEQRVGFEIKAARDLIIKITGFDSGFFRFPYGDRDPDTINYVREQKLAAFQWNMDPQDYSYSDPLRIYENFRKQLDDQRRGIALFHDTKRQTMLALPLILDELKRGGCTTVVFVRKRAPLP